MYPQPSIEHVEYPHEHVRTIHGVPTNDAYMGYYHLPTAPVTPQFDATYCSDFTCCGLTIPDLHGLLAHYEDIHCVTFTPDGFVPVLSPTQSQYSSAASSPRSSFSSSIPPSPVEVPPHGQASAFHTYYTTPYSMPTSTSSSPLEIMPPNILAYGSSLDGALGDNWQPTEEAKYCLPSNPFLLQDQQPAPCFVHPSTLIENRAAENRRLSGEKISDTDTDGQGQVQEDDRPDSRDSRVSISQSGASTASSSPPATPPSLTTESLAPSIDESIVLPSTGPVRNNKRRKGLGRHTDPADKPYKCPKPGCIKTYLNPNGLTYHLKKGTCEMA